jgi:hypothetical protein
MKMNNVEELWVLCWLGCKDLCSLQSFDAKSDAFVNIYSSIITDEDSFTKVMTRRIFFNLIDLHY